ncbi:Rv3235 family protein [Sinomonas susongensis]|uniref:Rv3235 family protein n=1 Tax=Sinomonas susongensis TaxID=1324851 RepID=UPI001FE94858|nr:Rv3235 family protein [Sinomonas susongensis]
MSADAVSPSAERHSVEQLAARITSAALEVLAGQRPVQQLAPWLPRDLLARLQLRANLGRADVAPPQSRAAKAHRASIVTSARASLVAPGIYEASAVVSDRLRSRAIALRLERRGSGRGWRVTALEIG